MVKNNQPHKYRCETCDHRKVNPNDDNFCEVIGDFIAGEIEMDTTAKVGCASHSNDGKAEQRIKDVIVELERRKKNLEVYTVGLEHGVSIGYEEALALLRGDE